MKGIVVLAGIAAAAVLAGIVIAFVNKEEELAPGDFTVYEESGKKVHMADYQGKPIIVNMWATWCPACTNELPVFEKMYKEYGSRVQFMMINSENKQGLENAKDYISKCRYTFPVYYDWYDSAYNVYGTGYIPLTLAFDARGNLVYNDTGRMSEKALRALIEDIL